MLYNLVWRLAEMWRERSQVEAGPKFRLQMNQVMRLILKEMMRSGKSFSLSSLLK
jgi:hypothetical protein